MDLAEFAGVYGHAAAANAVLNSKDEGNTRRVICVFFGCVPEALPPEMSEPPACCRCGWPVFPFRTLPPGGLSFGLS